MDGRAVDVRLDRGRIAEIGPNLPGGPPEFDGAGGALIPGLHDHHMHLFATVAANASVMCGPPAVGDSLALGRAVRSVAGVGWVRGVGYDESVAGDLDRAALDAIVDDRPVRIQHRSGALWVLNSAAIDLLGRDVPQDGRLWRRDEWLRDRLRDTAPPSLQALGLRLASYGVTGVTDASPGDAGALSAAARELPQHVVSLGDDTGDLCAGPRKIVLSDDALPGYTDLCNLIGGIHAGGRAVAVHSVTRESLLLLLAALTSVGARSGDRVEHAAVVPEEAIDDLVRLELTVVTQPSLVRERGDDYLDRVDPRDVGDLWRCGSLARRGVPVALSSDAPYGSPDPWRSISAAVERRTRSGGVLGEAEAITPAQALAGFLGDPLDPGRIARQVEVGAPADLALLAPAPGIVVGDAEGSSAVRATFIDGQLVHASSDDE
ncbi:MAG: amidohydrolase family protein [Microbacterium sp.]